MKGRRVRVPGLRCGPSSTRMSPSGAGYSVTSDPPLSHFMCKFRGGCCPFSVFLVESRYPETCCVAWGRPLPLPSLRFPWSCSLPVPALTSPRKPATLAPTQPHGTSDPALSSQPPQNAACGAAAGGTGGGNRCHPCWPRSDPGSQWDGRRVEAWKDPDAELRRQVQLREVRLPGLMAVVRRGCPKRQHCKFKCQDPGRLLHTVLTPDCPSGLSSERPCTCFCIICSAHARLPNPGVCGQKLGAPRWGWGAWPSLFALTSDGWSVFNTSQWGTRTCRSAAPSRSRGGWR
ncbi:uncharacterized protein LOC106694962 [Myotis lucifugus]|uniref:uncharacterized protein LOC106694962 n=1 Tax=Myotis lucifugus TaxID=59463 RepID=UPI000CCC93C4|nr:uncharacterized protein LOC106694962 [Myotis lucifugus]